MTRIGTALLLMAIVFDLGYVLSGVMSRPPDRHLELLKTCVDTSKDWQTAYESALAVSKQWQNTAERAIKVAEECVQRETARQALRRP